MMYEVSYRRKERAVMSRFALGDLVQRLATGAIGDPTDLHMIEVVPDTEPDRLRVAYHQTWRLVFDATSKTEALRTFLFVEGLPAEIDLCRVAIREVPAPTPTIVGIRFDNQPTGAAA